MRLIIAAPAAALALAACVSLFPDSGDPPQVYRLSAPTPAPTAEERRAWTVEVAPAIAERALSSNRVAVSTDGVEVAYAAGARWSAATPRLIQNLIIDTLSSDGRILAAVRPEDGVRASCELRLELASFEAVYENGEAAAPTANVNIRAMLIAPGTRRLAAASNFTSQVRAGDVRMRAIISAMDEAAHDAANQLVDWTLEQGAMVGADGATPCTDAAPPLRGAGEGES